MRRAERDTLRERYGFRCGYCGTPEASAGAQLTKDHFQPRSQGGSDELENLFYCCHACNEFKGDYWQPDSEQSLLHPLRDNLNEHFSRRTTECCKRGQKQDVFTSNDCASIARNSSRSGRRVSIRQIVSLNGKPS